MTKKEFRVYEVGLLGQCMASHGDIWQMDLLDPSRLASYIRERDVSFWESHIEQLWQLKLLRADLVASSRKLKYAGLTEVGLDNGKYLYADERLPTRKTAGWTNAIKSLPNFPDYINLYFHPFRYYVLYQLQRIIKSNIHPFQMLISKRYPGMIGQEIQDFQDWSSKPEFVQLINRWNDISTLCILIEPCFSERLFQILKYPPSIGYDGQKKEIARHWEELLPGFEANDLDELEKIRGDLCVSAEMLDQNKDVHTLLRLSQGGFRQKVKSRLGGALLIKSMAEMLRRAIERAHNVQLREEDELGFGFTPRGVKKKVYGAERLLDNASAARQYIRSFDLDYGVKTRWYVEGDTEYGALDSVLSRFRSIEMLNLKGNIAQKGRKGAAFVDNLKTDLRSQVFSVILIDADNEDYLRAVRKAAEDDLICGIFYISNPDFEFENFSLAELEEILWKIAVENGAEVQSRKKLHDAIKEASSGKELMDSARKALVELKQISKGEVWGQQLIAYASENPDMIREDGSTKGTKPIIEAISATIRGLSGDYHLTREKYRTDSTSGKLIPREGAT